MTNVAKQFGLFLAPHRDDVTRKAHAVAADRLGYGTVWLGTGRNSVGDLAFVEDLLDSTERITVATAIVNMWVDEPETLAESYHRLAGRYGERLLLGIGVGHPESVTGYRGPYAKIVDYLDRLDAAGVPAEARVLAALGDRVLKLAAERTAGAHPYLVPATHTRHARSILGAGKLLAPEHKVVVDDDPVAARAIGRPYVQTPYLGLSNYVNNLLRHGYTEADVAGGGSDRLIDDLVLHGTPETVAKGLRAHLDAGADHVAVQVLGASPEAELADQRRLAELLL
ncbi:LLM class F420-dependent oxidoreductase [Amycolatopsis sp. A133]|uniref:LLM class F420-dependent oxidoreductase n=1 Tax=Amycolatopsis sp. A133 TaxID=3064472 RepID=UPI0027EF1710|nr:LLM class F420-dependent oxidoreductase [Amycolatopsis sp. A133]MDQ7805063.1 LLM class F420-dependent oxidoreductase [Amycolatopsis sp. A133]